MKIVTSLSNTLCVCCKPLILPSLYLKSYYPRLHNGYSILPCLFTILLFYGFCFRFPIFFHTYLHQTLLQYSVPIKCLLKLLMLSFFVLLCFFFVFLFFVFLVFITKHSFLCPKQNSLSVKVR